MKEKKKDANIYMFILAYFFYDTVLFPGIFQQQATTRPHQIGMKDVGPSLV